MSETHPLTAASEKLLSEDRSKKYRKQGEALLNALQPDARRRAPEARHLHSDEQASNRIGHVVMSAELQSNSAKPERTKKAEAVPAQSEQHIEAMNRTELLELAATITIEGSSLRNIYDNNLLGEHGLRRLVIEHMRGGDVQKALRWELVEREIDFERDPAMRDVGHSSKSMTASSQASLDKLVEKAVERVAGDQIPSYETEAEAAAHKAGVEQAKVRNQIVDTVFVGTIVVLAILVIGVYFIRG